MAIRLEQIELASNQHQYPLIKGTGASQYMRIQTEHGYVDIGPNNSSYTHFYTDRNAYYFNANVSFSGNISSYSGGQTASFATYYDSNDTTYYVNPSGTGTSLKAAGEAEVKSLRLGNNFTLNQGASNYAQLGSWIDVLAVGLYSSNTNGAHFYPNTSSDYGTWRINGSRNNFNGISFGGSSSTANTLMSKNDGSVMGLYNDTDNKWYVEASRTGAVSLYFNGSAKLSTATNGINVTGQANASSFYDSDDTTYYADFKNSDRAVKTYGSVSIGTVGHLGLGDVTHPKVAYPGKEASWDGSGSTTGQVVIDLPGTLANYDMMYMEIHIYEYGSDAASKIIIGGHNWNSGGNSNTSTTQWYNNGVQVIGSFSKPIYLGRRNDGSNERRCIALGDTTSTWSYATVHVAKVHGACYYTDSIDYLGNWNVAQTTSGSYFTANPTTNWNTGATTTLKTPGRVHANYVTGAVDIRTPIYYDSNNTNYYINPDNASTSLRTKGDWRADSSSWSGEFAGKIQYHGNNWYFQSADSGTMVFRNASAANRFTFDMSSSIGQTAGSWRAPIFYDTDDTSYYSNPGGNSAMHSIGIDDYIFHTGDADTYFGFNGADQWKLHVGGGDRLIATTSLLTSNLKVRIPVAWDSGTLENNAIYAKNSTDGFGFGNGTGISTWWAWSTENGVMRMIDSANSGAYITLRTNNTDRVSITNSGLSMQNGGDIDVGNLRIVGDNSSGDEGMAYIRSNGDYLVLNAADGEHVYLNWDGAVGGSGHVYVDDRVYAKSLYDRNDTNYFMDPSGNSTVYQLYAGTTSADQTYNIRLEAANKSSIGFHDSGSTIGAITFSGAEGFRLGAAQGSYGPHQVSAMAEFMVSKEVTDASGQSIKGYRLNKATSSSWTEGGTGAQTGWYGGNFGGSEITTKWVDGPHGERTLAAETTGDTNNDYDGGYVKAINNLDINKSHLSIVYVKRISSDATGSLYHGTGAGANQITNLSGTSNTNPYFHSHGLSNYPQDVWCVSIGVIQANNDSNTTNKTGSGDLQGVYRCDTGQKILNSHTTWKMGSAGASLNNGIRFFHYYSTDADAKVQWAKPGFYEINGDEPSLAEILTGGNRGLHTNGGDVTANTFYDWANTAYYIDPASDSEMNQIWIDDYIRHRGNTSTYIGFPANNQISFQANNTERFRVEADVKVLGSTDLNIQGSSRRLQFTSGTGTVRTTNATDLILQSNSTNGLRVRGSDQAIVANVAVIAPIFYDSGDTNYYVNPASGSVLAGTVTIHNDADSSVSIQNGGTNAVSILAHAGDELYLGSDNASKLRLHSGGAVESYGDFRAPIFYDTDNTSYHVNPATSSSIKNLTVTPRLSSGTEQVVSITHGSGSHTGVGLGISSANSGHALNITGTVGSGYARITTAYNASPTFSISGDVIAYAASDKNFKDDLTVIPNALDKINTISGYTFTWNDKQTTYDTGKKDVGVVAQEIETVLPEIVDTRFDGSKAVKYDRIVALLIEGIKELQEEVKELKDKLNHN